MAGSVADLDKQREELQRKANVSRASRDKLNAEARKWADKRDELNAQVRGLVNQANEHKKRRDELNEQVQRAKRARDEHALKAEELHAKLDELRRQRFPVAGRPTHIIRKEIEKLEFDQQTRVLTVAKERVLIEQLQALHAEFREKEDRVKRDPELKELMEGHGRERESAEKQHQKVSEIAEKAQGEHDQMMKLFQESDKIRKEADKIQEKFVVAKMEADKVHKEYIEVVNQIHEIGDQIGSIVTKDRDERRTAVEKQVEEQADAIFEKFKKGEKLSTEDLMTLQKKGLL